MILIFTFHILPHTYIIQIVFDLSLVLAAYILTHNIDNITGGCTERLQTTPTLDTTARSFLHLSASLGLVFATGSSKAVTFDKLGQKLMLKVTPS